MKENRVDFHDENCLPLSTSASQGRSIPEKFHINAPFGGGRKESEKKRIFFCHLRWIRGTIISFPRILSIHLTHDFPIKAHYHYTNAMVKVAASSFQYTGAYCLSSVGFCSISGDSYGMREAKKKKRNSHEFFDNKNRMSDVRAPANVFRTEKQKAKGKWWRNPFH